MNVSVKQSTDPDMIAGEAKALDDLSYLSYRWRGK
jgi:hypothetical protein